MDELVISLIMPAGDMDVFPETERGRANELRLSMMSVWDVTVDSQASKWGQD